MRLRTTFSRKHVLAILLAFSVVAAAMGRRAARSLRQTAGVVLPPLADATMYAVTKLTSRLYSPGPEAISPEEAGRLQEENEYLRRLAAYWQYQQERYQRQAQELANFQSMYGPAQDLACELIPARVVAGGSLPYDGTRELTPGGGKGVQAGSPVTTRLLSTQRAKALPPKLAVLNANFLVGRITDAGAFTARLQLLTDRDFRANVRIRRVLTGPPRMVNITEGAQPRTTVLTAEINHPIEGMAHGDGADRLLVEDVKEYHKVRPGDLVLTSPLSGSVPMEIHVGRVVEVQRAKDPARVTLKVTPHAELASLRDVYIVSPVHPPAAEP